MSTILKALKRAEDTRARETIGGRIAQDFSERQAAPRRARFVRWGAAALLPAAAVGVAMYAHRGAGGPPPAIVRKELAPPPMAADAAPGRLQAPPAARSASAPPETAGTLTLSGVIRDGASAVAIINGRAVPMGGEIEGATVVRIGEDGVEVRRGGKLLTLTMQ